MQIRYFKVSQSINLQLINNSYSPLTRIFPFISNRFIRIDERIRRMRNCNLKCCREILFVMKLKARLSEVHLKLCQLYRYPNSVKKNDKQGFYS